MNKIKKELKEEISNIDIPSIDIIKNNILFKNAAEELISTPKINNKKNIFNFKTITLTISSLLLVMFLTLLIIPKNVTPSVPSYNNENFLFININPSIELILDENNIVENTRALNQEAVLVLLGENFIGVSADVALSRILIITNKLGYLVNNDIKLTYVNNDKEKEKINNDIYVEITKTLLIEYNLNNIVNTGYDESLEELSIKYNVSVAKMGLVIEVHNKTSISIDKLVNYSTESLKETLEDYDEELLELYEEKLNCTLTSQLIEINNKLLALELIEELIEEIEDALDDNITLLNELIINFNNSHEEYKIIYDNIDDLEDILEELLDRIDVEYEELEDLKDELKGNHKDDD